MTPGQARRARTVATEREEHMETTDDLLSLGDVRVWHIPQVPGKAFYVAADNISEAVKVCRILADYDRFQYEHRIKPDYANAQGIERYERDGDGGADWFTVEDDDDE